MGVCDLCHTELRAGEGTIIPLREMKRIAQSGFGPAKAGISLGGGILTVAHFGYAFGLTKRETDQAWRKGVLADKTPWVLCPNCCGKIRSFMKGGMRQVIEVKGATIEEARQKIRDSIPPDSKVISLRTIDIGSKKSIKETAPSVEAAIEKAKKKIPSGAQVISEKIHKEATMASMTVEAFQKAEARKAAKRQIPSKSSITRVVVIEKGRKGFLGIARTRDTFQIHYKIFAQVELTFRSPALIRVSFEPRKMHGARAGQTVRKISKANALRTPDGNKIVLVDAPVRECYEVAMAFFGKAKWGECVSELTKAIKIDPNFSEGYFWRAAAYFMIAVGQEIDGAPLDEIVPNCERSIADYSRAIELDPSNAKAYINRSGVFWSLGREDEAEKDLIKARQIDPDGMRGQKVVISEDIRKRIDQLEK